tara:strand:+ start:1560 stop:1952 length:393 start_codon:yes stop_codon:yes gene_type:complete
MKKKTFLISLFGLSLIFSSAFGGDAKKGKKIFKKCAACHNVASGSKHKTGPKLWNIVGAIAGVQNGYRYSEWLKDSGIKWNDETLAAWLGTNKEKAKYFGKDVRKSRMIFAGLRKKEQIVNLIAYLKTLK